MDRSQDICQTKAEGVVGRPAGEARGPVAASSRVSAQMRRMPRAGTGPELALRRQLHARGLRFRVNVRGLPGRPDIALTRARIAVFVDGCFWHRCPDHGVLPKNNTDWWDAKLAENVARDRRKDSALRADGWSVIHVWEHEDPAAAADNIAAEWSAAVQRDVGPELA